MLAHVLLVDFVVLPPGHGRNVTNFWGWDTHEVQLRCPDDVWVVIEGDEVPRAALNLNSTNLPRPWSPRESSPSRKIPTVEPRIKPGTSWLVVRDSDHWITRLVGTRNFYIWFLNKPTKGVQEKERLILWNTRNYLVHNFQAFTSN